ncbi:DEAD/DEAH box helicase family protein [Pasteurella oralis]|uniref:DEAD/DEAH box helicase family protein n=1 Tax=Pasteurella oralis TaxID=1071947 RepID=A0ABW4NTL3_9PAST
MIGLKLKDFQQQAVDFLMSSSNKKAQIVMKSPTGSGKTIILIRFIETFWMDYPNAIFCWFTVGKGDLEQQSKERMERFSPTSRTATLSDILNGGFEQGTSYFINWETITKKGNIALKESERKNLKQHIADAHRANKKFIVIIDEEHQNDTAKARDIIDTLNADMEIRVSATPQPNPQATFYEIKEVDVINEGLITRAMYINKDLNTEQMENIQNETALLLQKADSIRQQIAAAYLQENEVIRPLVLVQFPNMNDELIEFVETKLAEMGYSYENKMVAKWLSPENSQDKKSHKIGKINIGEIDQPDSITHHNAEPVFLLFKQALATGWDCPRAKVLVKLRENMSESFEIQTLGRLRRMPMARHYGKDILDCSYLYTFDEKYKEAARKSGGNEYLRLFLKDEPKRVELKKELRNKDADFENDVEVRSRLYEFFKTEFKLTSNVVENQRCLENAGFVFGEHLYRQYLTGRYRTLHQIKEEPNQYHALHYLVNTHEHGIDLRQHIDSLKKHLGLSYERTRQMLQFLFLADFGLSKYKLLKLNLKGFYAFVINNIDKFNILFIQFASAKQQHSLDFGTNPLREDVFKIPLQALYPYDPTSVATIFERNAYKNYSSQITAGTYRSICERLFEKYCECNPNVAFVYKNGDTGQDYLSIVYYTGVDKQRLFYPDYIVKTTSGEIWLIETKGGEDATGRDKNIDPFAALKFNALKAFAKKHGYQFGFVRDKDLDLYLNNQEYVDDMAHPNWVQLTL